MADAAEDPGDPRIEDAIDGVFGQDPVRYDTDGSSLQNKARALGWLGLWMVVDTADGVNPMNPTPRPRHEEDGWQRWRDVTWDGFTTHGTRAGWSPSDLVAIGGAAVAGSFILGPPGPGDDAAKLARVSDDLADAAIHATKKGGRYADVRAANTGGETHHMPANSASPLSKGCRSDTDRPQAG